MKTNIKSTFPVIGMTCASCAINVESMLSSEPGVVKANVNFASNTVLVEYHPDEISKEQLKNSVKSIGYDLEIREGDDTLNQVEELNQKPYTQLRTKTLASILLSVPLIVIGMFFMHKAYSNYIMWILSTPIVVIFGRQFFINAWKQAKHRSTNMDTLVALSTGVAYVFSVFNTLFQEFWHRNGMHAEVYFESAGVVIAFILLGKLLEEKAKSNTSTAIKKLIGLQPKTVIKLDENGTEHSIPVTEVQVNDLILVKPGEKIPVDGSVKQGHSSVDESSINGEAVPSEKLSGDKVFAGTINQKGVLQITALKVGGETLLAQIIKMVQEAQGSKAPVQKRVDKIAGIFVPIVIGIALLTFIIWVMLGSENALTHALLSMITVLVIACPCALGLATPTAIMVGIGKGADLGILIKDAESLEHNKNIDTIILDKTGTITQGQPEVTDLIWSQTTDHQKDIRLLYEIERQSEHPLAEAVTAHFQEFRNSGHVLFDKFESVTGRGVIAKYEAHSYFVGNTQLMEENSVSLLPALIAERDRLVEEAKTVILFAQDHEVLALIAITDKLKPSSASAIQELQEQGIKVYMLSGDNTKTAEAVAKAVGIKEFKAELLPADKANFIKDLQAQGKVVAMVGDGINDSQALAQADISIAMGKGSDIAIDVAKTTILSSDLLLIAKAIKLSKRTVRVIKQNLFWAFIYNVIGIPLAAGVLYPINGFLLNPMIAGAAMALSSVSVISNSLLLKWRKI